MKRRIGELKGTPLVETSSDDIITENELAISINDSNDAITSIKKREGNKLISIINTDNGDSEDISTPPSTTPPKSNIVYFECTVREVSSTERRTLHLPIIVPKPDAFSDWPTRFTSNEPITEVRITLDSNPTKEAIEYVEDYKKYLESRSYFLSVDTEVQEEESRSIFTFHITSKDLINGYYVNLDFYPVIIPT